jgi:hypothetical protein
VSSLGFQFRHEMQDSVETTFRISWPNAALTELFASSMLLDVIQHLSVIKKCFVPNPTRYRLNIPLSRGDMCPAIWAKSPWRVMAQRAKVTLGDKEYA